MIRSLFGLFYIIFITFGKKKTTRCAANTTSSFLMKGEWYEEDEGCLYQLSIYILTHYSSISKRGSPYLCTILEICISDISTRSAISLYGSPCKSDILRILRLRSQFLPPTYSSIKYSSCLYENFGLFTFPPEFPFYFRAG